MADSCSKVSAPVVDSPSELDLTGKEEDSIDEIEPRLELDGIAREATELLSFLDNLWCHTGFLVGSEPGELAQKTQLSLEILEPIQRRINEAKKLQEQQEALILKLTNQATLQGYSLAISVSLCKPSLHLTLKEQICDWEILTEEFDHKTEQRKGKISILREELLLLCHTLDEKSETIFPDLFKQLEVTFNGKTHQLDDLSSQQIAKHEESLEAASRMIQTLKKTIDDLKEKISKLWEDLKFTDEQKHKHPVDKFAGTPDDYNFFSKKNQTRYSLKKSITLLENRLKELEEKYSRLVGAVEDLMPKIYKLWVELDVQPRDPHRYKLWFALIKKKNPSVAEQEDFLAQLSTRSVEQRFPTSVIELCEEEYSRLVELKAEMMKQLILVERERLTKYWDKLHFSEEQRREFEPGFSEEYTQETLDAIKAEIERLRGLWQSMGAILKHIERREWIKSEMKRFEKTASDPNRFKGSSTRLLEEEKFRKVVAKEFPRLTNFLRKTLVKWQKEHGGEAFYYAGEPYLETMNKEEDNPNFDLLHLRLFTSKPGETPEEIQTPTIQAVAERKAKPATNPRPRPSIISPRGPDDLKSRPQTTGRSVNSRDVNGSSVTPLRSTRPRSRSSKSPNK